MANCTYNKYGFEEFSYGKCDRKLNDRSRYKNKGC